MTLYYAISFMRFSVPDSGLYFEPVYCNYLGPFHEQFHHRNSNSTWISFCFQSRCSEVIVMKFCTWYDSCAVMACAKFCSNMIPYCGVTLKPIFPQIWIAMEKSFVKWTHVFRSVLILTKPSQWHHMSVNLKPWATQLFVQQLVYTNNKENIKTLHHWVF